MTLKELAPERVSARRGALWTSARSYVAIGVIGAVAYVAITQLRGDQGLVAVLAVIWAIALTGLNVVQGLGGYPSIAQAAFFGIGAYSSSILFEAGWDFIPAALAAVGLGALAGALLALVFSRTRGQYFAIGTLFFGAMGTLVATNQIALTGGFNGFPVGLGMSIPTLMLVLVLSLVVGLVLFELMSRSRFGDRLRSIRSDEDLAEHLGVPTATTKALAIVVSAVFGAWAGVLLAQYNGIVAPSQFSFIQGFLMFVAVGIGGYGRLFTPIVGGVVVIGLSQLLKLQPGVSQIALGVLFLVITLLMPGGMIGSIERLLKRIPRARRERP
jgi:branched-chain amino acid transport system permease protein